MSQEETNTDFCKERSAPAEKLLPRLKNVRRGEYGWRADCPNPIHEHGHGSKGKGALSVTEKDEILLIHCFSCFDTASILASVGLELSDLYPDPVKDTTPKGRRTAREAHRRNSWAAALRVLSYEATVVLLSGRDLMDVHY